MRRGPGTPTSASARLSSVGTRTSSQSSRCCAARRAARCVSRLARPRRPRRRRAARAAGRHAQVAAAVGEQPRWSSRRSGTPRAAARARALARLELAADAERARGCEALVRGTPTRAHKTAALRPSSSPSSAHSAPHGEHAGAASPPPRRRAGSVARIRVYHFGIAIDGGTKRWKRAQSLLSGWALGGRARRDAAHDVFFLRCAKAGSEHARAAAAAPNTSVREAKRRGRAARARSTATSGPPRLGALNERCVPGSRRATDATHRAAGSRCSARRGSSAPARADQPRRLGVLLRGRAGRKLRRRARRSTGSGRAGSGARPSRGRHPGRALNPWWGEPKLAAARSSRLLRPHAHRPLRRGVRATGPRDRHGVLGCSLFFLGMRKCSRTRGAAAGASRRTTTLSRPTSRARAALRRSTRSSSSTCSGRRGPRPSSGSRAYSGCGAPRAWLPRLNTRTWASASKRLAALGARPRAAARAQPLRHPGVASARRAKAAIRQIPGGRPVRKATENEKHAIPNRARARRASTRAGGRGTPAYTPATRA